MNENMVDTFINFMEGKDLDNPTMLRVMEEVVRTLIRKKYGTDENFDVIVNVQQGDIDIFRLRDVVPDGEIADENMQIALSEALEMEDDYTLGDECVEKINVVSFGRRAVMASRQTLISKLMELEKDKVYKKYKDRVGEIVLGEVHQILKRELLVLDDATNIEINLPRNEMIRADYYKKGDLVKGVIEKVEMKNNNPKVIMSRTSPKFLEKLMENEVPEIEDGLITVKKIVRIPGDRAKVAVESYDDRIDPVGACVGMKGSRIHSIVRELKKENIDIINFTTNPTLFIQRSLTPAKITSIELDEENKRASVYLDSDQVSLAIGSGGSNIKLASRITGYEIDVFKDNVEEIELDDVELDEFKDEIEEWIIEEFKQIGYDTAKAVLRQDKDALVRRTDLEEETIENVLKLLAAEFEEEEEEE